MMIKNALVYTLDQGFVDKEVYIENGYFVEKPEDVTAVGEVIDAHGNYLIPGLVDVHFHGCMGEDFSDASLEGMHKIGRYELENGITTICPASMTLPEEKLSEIVKVALAYKKMWETQGEETGARMGGIHLEGPFVSPKKKGAQNAAYIRKPDIALFQKLQSEAQNMIKLITIAPELPEAEQFIRTLYDQVHISIGHTECDFSCAKKAFESGADHVTHCFNAMNGFGHREPGILGAAFDDKNAVLELICDGIHIAPTTIRMVFSMFGKERLILISDSMRAAGLEDGNYTLGGLAVAVSGERATLSDGTLAGSVLNLMDCLKKVVGFGIPLEDAVRCATYNPAKSIGIENVCGSIEAGKYADCVLISKENLEIMQVIALGKRIRC